jgi:thiamine-monophosphate kinase
VSELDLIAQLLPYLATRGGDLVIGAGEDDAAAWTEPDGTFIVATIDTSVESVHFDLERQRPEDVGWRALCFALGDLAAKGARPAYGLASLALPKGWPPETAVGIYRGMAELARGVGLRLIGGDTSSTPGLASLTLALVGRTAIQPRPRSAVQAGWAVGVTGPLGGAGIDAGRPWPRLEQGEQLARAGLVCGDISDGLVREHDKLSAIAGIGARLQIDLVPRVPGVSPEAALASGEEVELVCWGPPPLPPGIWVVGELTSDARVLVLDAQGREVAIEDRGYDHFA